MSQSVYVYKYLRAYEYERLGSCGYLRVYVVVYLSVEPVLT